MSQNTSRYTGRQRFLAQILGTEPSYLSNDYARDNEIDAPFMAPSELIETVCLLPWVVTESLALNAAALTTTSNWPLPARPSRLPPTFRVISLHVPESAPSLASTSLFSSNL